MCIVETSKGLHPSHTENRRTPPWPKVNCKCDRRPEPLFLESTRHPRVRGGSPSYLSIFSAIAPRYSDPPLDYGQHHSAETWRRNRYHIHPDTIPRHSPPYRINRSHIQTLLIVGEVICDLRRVGLPCRCVSGVARSI